jgi:hypothetical protein
MYTFGLLGDACLEKLTQAVYAWMPGLGTPTANPLLGNDRVLVQAPLEPSPSFTKRLSSSFDTWATAGNDESVLQQILTYFTPWLPLIRIVSNTGSWSWYEAGSSNFLTTAPNHYQALFTVVGASNTSPIVITTAVAYAPMTTGAVVTIEGVGGLNGVANSEFVITAVSPTSFSLNGISGVGLPAYTGGGVVSENLWTWDEVENPITFAPAWWRDWMVVYPGLSVAGRVSGASGTPIEITTTAANALVTGNQVCVTEVGGNITANTYATVTVIDSTHFTLNGTASNGAYTSGGSVYLIPASTLEAVPSTTPVGPGIVSGQLNPATGAPYVCGTETGGMSCGFNVPVSFFLPMLPLIATWHAANSWFRYSVFSFDTTVFSPWSTPGTEPQGARDGVGSWGNWAVTIGGVVVPNRNPDARYVGGVQ